VTQTKETNDSTPFPSLIYPSVAVRISIIERISSARARADDDESKKAKKHLHLSDAI
jgi:hypothetical protein